MNDLNEIQDSTQVEVHETDEQSPVKQDENTEQDRKHDSNQDEGKGLQIDENESLEVVESPLLVEEQESESKMEECDLGEVELQKVQSNQSTEEVKQTEPVQTVEEETKQTETVQVEEEETKQTEPDQVVEEEVKVAEVVQSKEEMDESKEEVKSKEDDESTEAVQVSESADEIKVAEVADTTEVVDKTEVIEIAEVADTTQEFEVKKVEHSQEVKKYFEVDDTTETVQSTEAAYVEEVLESTEVDDTKETVESSEAVFFAEVLETKEAIQVVEEEYVEQQEEIQSAQFAETTEVVESEQVFDIELQEQNNNVEAETEKDEQDQDQQKDPDMEEFQDVDIDFDNIESRESRKAEFEVSPDNQDEEEDNPKANASGLEQSCVELGLSTLNQDNEQSPEKVSDQFEEGELPEPDDFRRHQQIVNIDHRASVQEDYKVQVQEDSNMLDDLARIKLVQDLQKLRMLFLNAEFSQASSYIQNRILLSSTSPDSYMKLSQKQNIFFNILFIYVLFKLKEFSSAISMAKDVIKEVERQSLLSSQSDDRIFTVKYILAACKSTETYVVESLLIYYELYRETESKLRTSRGVHVVKPDSSEEQNYSVQEAMDIEAIELFGLIPAKDDFVARHIMLTHEICRIHTRQTDYRNAYKVISRCVKLFPKNPYVLSKAGRYCLEVGRKAEAISYFDKVRVMLKVMTSQQAKPKPSEGINIDSVLGHQTSGPEKEYTNLLLVLVSLNDGFLFLFNGNPTDAQNAFRYIQNYKPSNIVASNNIATANIFCSQPKRSIELLMQLIQQDMKANLNEQILQNIISFQEVQYPPSSDGDYSIQVAQKSKLIENCQKNGKDAVRAMIQLSLKNAKS